MSFSSQFDVYAPAHGSLCQIPFIAVNTNGPVATRLVALVGNMRVRTEDGGAFVEHRFCMDFLHCESSSVLHSIELLCYFSCALSTSFNTEHIFCAPSDHHKYEESLK